jgi:hypothetical protein
VQSVSISDYNDKVTHSILLLALSFFLFIPWEPAYLQFNKAPAISICFLQLFLQFESGASKLSLNPTTLAMETFIILTVLVGALTIVKSHSFSVEEELEQ